MEWITTHWAGLVRGGKLHPPAWLPHPRVAGFRALDLATPEGQCANWALPLTDGSRIHVHEFADGSLAVHRDRHDPNAGPEKMIAHLLTETFVGAVVLGFALFAIVRRSQEA